MPEDIGPGRSRSAAGEARTADAPRGGSGLVAIILVNWNGWRDTLECLESLRRLDAGAFFIILVDNGSTDGSLDRILEWCGSRCEGGSGPSAEEPVRERFAPVSAAHPDLAAEIMRVSGSGRVPLAWLSLDANNGFAAGNNVALLLARSLPGVESMWLLNNDTVVHPRALRELVDASVRHPRAGILGSALYDYDHPGRLQSLGYRKIVLPVFGSSALSLEHDGIRTVKWVNGASLLIKRRTLDDVGLIDERYFLFWEEQDWCVRALHRGWLVAAVASSRVWHKWGSSSNSRRITRRFLGRSRTRIRWQGYGVPGYYESRNGVYFVRKLYPALLPAYVVARTLHLLLQVLAYDDRKAYRMGVILRGTLAGLLGKMGKTLDPAYPMARAGNPAKERSR